MTRRRINVSGEFDNCFFHCLSAHMLLQNIPLPKGLFQAKAGSPAGELCKIFSDRAHFDAYFASLQREFPNKQFMQEKTLVLGVLFRQYNADLLKQQNQQVQSAFADQMKRATVAAWMKTKEPGYALNADDFILHLKGSQFGTLVSSNEGWFREIYAGTNELIQPLNHLLNTTYQNDFNQLRVSKRALKKNPALTLPDYLVHHFLDKTNIPAGVFNLYIAELQQPNVKLSYEDLKPLMLNELHIPFTVNTYGGNGILFSEAPIEGSNYAPLEVSLSGQVGHYYLHEEESPAVIAYEKELLVYEAERTALGATTLPQNVQNAIAQNYVLKEAGWDQEVTSLMDAQAITEQLDELNAAAISERIEHETTLAKRKVALEKRTSALFLSATLQDKNLPEGQKDIDELILRIKAENRIEPDMLHEAAVSSQLVEHIVQKSVERFREDSKSSYATVFQNLFQVLGQTKRTTKEVLLDSENLIKQAKAATDNPDLQINSMPRSIQIETDRRFAVKLQQLEVELQLAKRFPKEDTSQDEILARQLAEEEEFCFRP